LDPICLQRWKVGVFITMPSREILSQQQELTLPYSLLSCDGRFRTLVCKILQLKASSKIASNLYLQAHTIDISLTTAPRVLPLNIGLYLDCLAFVDLMFATFLV
jgi:hypothetical protein